MNRDTETRARIENHWAASERGDTDAEHEIYAADAVLDYPQSGERFRGREKIQAQRCGHPADRHFAVRRISGRGNLWISECVITYDGEHLGRDPQGLVERATGTSVPFGHVRL